MHVGTKCKISDQNLPTRRREQLVALRFSVFHVFGNDVFCREFVGDGMVLEILQDAEMIVSAVRFNIRA
jgi:hypothetical protein